MANIIAGSMFFIRSRRNHAVIPTDTVLSLREIPPLDWLAEPIGFTLLRRTQLVEATHEKKVARQHVPLPK